MAQRLWSRLEDAWGVRAGYWYPLREIGRRDVLAFEASAFDEALVASGRLHAIFATRGIERAFELREGGGAFQVALGDLEPAYTGEEGYWCSDAMDWLLYASHENSVTVAGEWLISAVKAAWPAWERHVWT